MEPLHPDLTSVPTDFMLTELSRRGINASDCIVYCVVTNPGGIDGMDRRDNGGLVKFASFDKAEASAKVDAWSKVEARVVDLVEAKKVAVAKLDKIDRLILGAEMPVEPRPTKRAPLR